MHIAICDDDVAHRKHFERLMQRESNARTVVDSPLYIDSFGSKEALFYAPMQYNIFFLSIKGEEYSVYDLVKQLRDLNVLAPIVIVKLDNKEYADDGLYEDLYSISDPLKPAELHAMVKISHEFSQNAQHLYEIHGIHETRYLPEDMILYADVRNNGKYNLHLNDNSCIECDMPLKDFFHMTEADPAFAYTGKNVIINLRYLEKIRPTKVVLQGDIILPMSFGERPHMRKQQEHFLTTLNE